MSALGRVTHDIGGECDPKDAAIGALAARQHGVVSHAGLRRIGLGRRAIEHRLATGRLHRLYRGVYAVGHPLVSPLGRLMAAVLACGPDALLSHRSAGGVWDIARTARPLIDVTAGRGCRKRKGIVVHRPRFLDPRDRTLRHGIPVTSWARTVLDLATVLTPSELVRALEESERLRLFDLRQIDELLDRQKAARGAPALRAALAELSGEPPDTHSPLEDRFLDFCRERGLSEPSLNVSVAGFMVDAVWPGHGVVVELDSRAHHSSRSAFEADRKRDTKLQIAGQRIVRVTDRRLRREADDVYEDLRSLLD